MRFVRITRKSVLLMLQGSFWSELSHKNTVLIGIYKALLLFQQNHQQHHCHTTPNQENCFSVESLGLLGLLSLLLLTSPRESAYGPVNSTANASNDVGKEQ